MLSPTSKGGRCLRYLWPTLVVNLSHQSRPEPRLQPLEPLRGDRTEPNQPSIEAEQDPPQTRVENHPPLARVESIPPPARVGSHLPQVQVERHPSPARAVNQPPQAEVRNQLPREALSTCPRGEKECAMVPGPTGTKGPCVRPRVESLSPKGLPI